jgi:sugar phosphate isomerase/epimerase
MNNGEQRDMNDNRSRREFLRTAGLGIAALAVGEKAFSAIPPATPRVGVQLYSVRKEIEKDFDATMKKIADMGFEGVEYYPFSENIKREHAAKLLKDLGLKVLGLHTPLAVGNEREHAVRLAEIFDCKRVVFPGGDITALYGTRDAMKKTVETYNTVAEYLGSHGLTFGLHNHSAEFENHGGVEPFPYLLKNLDPRVFFELDVYWVQVAGKDPVTVTREFGKRAPLFHIKDGPGVKGPTQDDHVPAGKGKVDIAGIVKAAKPHADWLIVEFDDYKGDIFDGIRQSCVYVKGLLH